MKGVNAEDAEDTKDAEADRFGRAAPNHLGTGAPLISSGASRRPNSSASFAYLRVLRVE